MIYAPELFKRKRRAGFTLERDEFLRRNIGIDPAILADALGLTERFIIHYQRRLGIRPLTGGWKPKERRLA